ncbi:unnamed protein product [Leptidea sinapis]|uniref:Uncharacterized protein n=1 Tax=Leptidea sinapis TaxID=189913 RepID=A0A5E4Q2S1_9NEOP|nr:unnamed protein product [Leptidea sinapis]
MTNNGGEHDVPHERRMAALTAVHLVSQVLEEANVIANAAYDSVIHGNTEYMLIGQGDEVFNDDSDTTKSTSLFINNLFDLSDVELTAYCDESETQDIIEPDILVTMKSIMETFINSALNRAFGEETVSQSKTPSDVSSQSSYSYMDDATFPTLKDDILNNYGEGSNMVVPVENHDANIDKVDLASYENAFLTLNREEQCSENQEEPITLAEPNPRLRSSLQYQSHRRWLPSGVPLPAGVARRVCDSWLAFEDGGIKTWFYMWEVSNIA